jgi:hypothetical protein
VSKSKVLNEEMRPEFARLKDEIAKAQKELDEVNQKYGQLQRTMEKIRELKGNLRFQMIRLYKVQSREDKLSAPVSKEVQEEGRLVPLEDGNMMTSGIDSGYGEIRQKIEQITQNLPDAQSDRRDPPTDRPPDKPLSGDVYQKIEQVSQNLPDAQSDRRGSPTDRPPDKPPPWKGAFAGSSYERAISRHVSQLASSRVSNGLGGNASPRQECIYGAKRPSNQCHISTAAGSSQGSPANSWMHTSHRQSRVKPNTCVANGNPSSNLGRNLFPPRRFSCGAPNQLVQSHSATTITSIRWLAT